MIFLDWQAILKSGLIQVKKRNIKFSSRMGIQYMISTVMKGFYYCQEFSVTENLEKEDFYDVYFDLSILTGNIYC